MKCSRILFCE
jgi:hypothetical protein